MRPDEIRTSNQGKLVAAQQEQTKQNIKNLFQLLRKRTITNDILAHLASICEHLRLREYVKANDAYYLLSIGNAPWPLGVTAVGIHERSAREKISSSKVARKFLKSIVGVVVSMLNRLFLDVLNDETQRKWIQSVKRLMTYCQNKFPADDPTKMVG